VLDLGKNGWIGVRGQGGVGRGEIVMIERVGGERGSVEGAENVGRQVELVGRVWGKERLFRSGVED